MGAGVLGPLPENSGPPIERVPRQIDENVDPAARDRALAIASRDSMSDGGRIRPSECASSRVFQVLRLAYGNTAGRFPQLKLLARGWLHDNGSWGVSAEFVPPPGLTQNEEHCMGNTISYRRPDGGNVNAYLAEGKHGAAAPGVVVIQEWWGLNDQIRGVADKLATAGYRALVPDLYRGKLALDANEAGHLMNGLDFAAAAGQDVRGAVQHLKATGSAKVGVTGFCMGGALTLLAAVNVPEADAFVVWYGYPPLEYIDAARIRAPLLAHWGTEDTVFPIDKVALLETKLREAKVSFEFHRYHAKHAFANETVDTKNLAYLKHNSAAAELAWQRTVEFFGKHLK